ncbi:MAG: NHLP bacteriocin system secretion protein, partial [Planctomycetota bacterium]|nr:NHLP bacteriocin system secretion protein [Planctomycetota bacterium]
LQDELNEAELQLEEQRSRNERLDAFDEEAAQLEEELLAVDLDRREKTIQFAEERIERLNRRRALISEMIDRGTMVEIDRERIDEQIEQTQLEREKAELEREQRRAAKKTADFERERGRIERTMRVEELKRRVELLETRLKRESEVRSPFDGVVVELRAATQTALNVGDPVMLLQPLDEADSTLEAILYVSATTGKRIRRGMDALISPSTVNREEHGSLVGEVSYISDVPTSRSAMMAVLSDHDLVEQLTREVGVPLEMRVRLRRDERTPSGYEWTSALGPPRPISAGTLCQAEVTVRKQRPIALVIPMGPDEIESR